MRVLSLTSRLEKKILAARRHRSVRAETAASRIVGDVRRRGDAALFAWTWRLDGVRVTNFARNGEVSTEEVLDFLLRLPKRPAPALVIFYDGLNEVMSTMVNDQAGVPWIDNDLREAFEIATNRTLMARKWVSGLGFIRAFDALKSQPMLAPRRHTPRCPTSGLSSTIGGSTATAGGAPATRSSWPRAR